MCVVDDADDGVCGTNQRGKLEPGLLETAAGGT